MHDDLTTVLTGGMHGDLTTVLTGGMHGDLTAMWYCCNWWNAR